MKKNSIDFFREYTELNKEIFPSGFSEIRFLKFDQDEDQKKGNIFVKSKIYKSSKVYPFPFYKPISSLIIPENANEK